MPATTPTTPPKKTAEDLMGEARLKLKNKPGFSLLVDGEEVDIRMVIRPVKIKIIKTALTNVGAGNKQQAENAGTARTPGQAEIQAALNNFRAKIVGDTEKGKEVKEYTETEKGPYIELPLPEKLKDTLKVNYSSADMGQT